MKAVFTTLRFASPLVLASCLAGTAIAQTTVSTPAEPEASSGLEDIVVTARKVSENLQDVPVSITAFSGDQMIKQNIQKVADVAQFTPGLAIRQTSTSAAGISISLRGQVQTDVLATLDPSVGTYVDGVYWARAYGLNTDLLDISSLQVLKGPQGTLFGRNTTGGALLITSNDPNTSSISGRAAVTYGRFNEFQATGVLNLPIVTDRLAVRLAVQRTTRDPFITNVVPATVNTAVPANAATQAHFPGSQNGQKYDDRDRWAARGKLLWKATDNLSFLLSAEHFRQDETPAARILRLALPAYAAANTTYNTGAIAASVAGGAGGVAAGLSTLASQAAYLAANPGQVINDERPFLRTRTYTYNATASLDTFFGNIKLISSYRRISTANSYDLDGTQYAVLATESLQHLKQKSVEAQFTGKAFNDRVDFAAGAFVFHESGSDQTLSITAPSATSVTTSHNIGIIDNDSIGLYGQTTWHITDQISFTGGLRYSVDDKGLTSRNNTFNRTTRLTTCLLKPGAPFDAGGELVSVPACSVSRKDDFSGVSYTAGVDYKPTDDLLLYAKTSKGFRSGGQNLRAPSAAFFIPFLPEIAFSHEIGLKSELFDRRLRANFAAYTSDIKNIQRSTLIAAPTGTGTATILGNAGKARVRGIEAEIQAQVLPGLRLSLAGGLTDPKYIRFADLSGDRSFERFSSIPKKQWSAAADYTTDVSFGTLNARVDYAWTGKMPLDPYFYAANPLNAAIVAASTKPAFGVLGSRVSVGVGEHFDFAVYGRNLTNNRAIVNSALIIAPLGFVSGTRNEPRTFGVTGSYKF